MAPMMTNICLDLYHHVVEMHSISFGRVLGSSIHQALELMSPRPNL